MRARPWRIIRPKPLPRVTGSAVLFAGDSAQVLKSQASNSVDAIVTDPPYALASIVKRFGNPNYAPAKGNQAFIRASRGFMGQTWDNGDVAHTVEFWRECFRILKPGAFVLAFGGTRNYHRLACAIEDAGFEIRDMVQWLYGSGFPKNRNALKPANEPICMARKPLSEKTVAANLLRWGTGAINIDRCKVESETPRPARSNERSASGLTGLGGAVTYGAFAVRGSIAIGETMEGRWPANVITDGSDEVVAAFPNAPGQIARSREDGTPQGNKIYGAMIHGGPVHFPRVEQSNSAVRFYYCAKATKKDRAGSKHPTVKPVALIRYLCRLVTPVGGIVLDPFAGTGTTGEAAHLEGFKVIMIEREARFVADIRSRMAGLNVELTDVAAQ